MRANCAFLRLGGLSRPIRLRGCLELVERLPSYFRGWQIEVESIASGQSALEQPVMELSHHPRGYKLTAAWLKKPLHRKTEVDAVCALIAELSRAYAEDATDLLCLHGAAAEFAGRLLVFPNRYRAGKSVLIAALSAAGQRVFGDDVLFIAEPNDHGMAAGFAPRLRRPLPSNLLQDSRDFIAAHSGPSNESYLYLDLPGSLLAPHGTLAPIGAFVLLERQEDGDTVLEPVRRAEVLRQVIWQNFARASAAPRILQRLEALVDQAGCYRLRYQQAEAAVALLQARFANWDSVPSPKPAAASPLGGRSSGPNLLLPPGPGEFRQNLEITERTVDGEQFLADGSGQAIHHLNPVGSAVWRLLAQPMSLDTVTDQLHAAFPDVSRSVIRADLENLFGKLVAKGLLIAGTAPRRPA